MNASQELNNKIKELLNQKSLNSKASNRLVHQTYQLIKKNSLIFQLNRELEYTKALNNKYSLYLTKIKETTEQANTNYKGIKAELNAFKAKFSNFITIVDENEEEISKLKKIKELYIRDGQNRINNKKVEIKDKKKLLDEKEYELIKQQNQLEKTKKLIEEKEYKKQCDKEYQQRLLIDDLKKYEKLLQANNLMKNKNYLLEKSHQDAIEYSRKLLTNKKIANQMLENENIQVEINELKIQNENLKQEIQDLVNNIKTAKATAKKKNNIWERMMNYNTSQTVKSQLTKSATKFFRSQSMKNYKSHSVRTKD